MTKSSQPFQPTSACDEPMQHASTATCERGILECGCETLFAQPRSRLIARMEFLFRECFASHAADQALGKTIHHANATAQNTDEEIAHPSQFQERNR